MHATVLKHLGKWPVSRFMRSYWGRRPLLIRKALPDFVSPTTRAELFALAARDDVESRLVTAFGGRWQLHAGPFARRALPPLKKPDWTLLVQGVDLQHAGAHALLSRFRFVPDARLDDLMASYASPGGGVGPHVDSYDVFLLQAHGRRRWRISRQRDQQLVADLPLKILRDFRSTAEWILEPGDMLYLPPGVAHEGVALDENITLSIGFRAPQWQELVEPWFAHLAERARLSGRYRDTGSGATSHPAQLPAELLRETRRQLAQLRPSADSARVLLLEILSEPKANVVFDRPMHPLTRSQFTARLHGKDVRLQLDRRTRALYSDDRFAINGDVVVLHAGDALLVELADRRSVAAAAAARAGARVAALLHEWYVAGWLHADHEQEAYRANAPGPT